MVYEEGAVWGLVCWDRMRKGEVEVEVREVRGTGPVGAFWAM